MRDRNLLILTHAQCTSVRGTGRLFFLMKIIPAWNDHGHCIIML